MAEELQSLLERIQKDGVDKARAESDRILAEARAKADTVLKEAGDKAAALVKKAEADSAVFAERGRASLEQAARDVILSVGQMLQSVLQDIATAGTAQALSTDLLKQLIPKIVDYYFKDKAGQVRLELILAPAQQKELSEFLLARMTEEIRKGLQIKADGGLLAGFKVSVVKDKVQHDVTAPAIAEAICQLVRPQLAEIVRKAVGQIARDQTGKTQTSTRGK